MFVYWFSHIWWLKVVQWVCLCSQRLSHLIVSWLKSSLEMNQRYEYMTRYWQQHITEVRTRISHAEWNKYKYLLGWIYPNLNSDSFWGFVDDHVMTERKFHDTIKNRRKTSNHKKIPLFAFTKPEIMWH